MGIDDVLLVDAPAHIDQNPNLQKKKFSDYLGRDPFLTKIEQNKFKGVDALIHLGACSDTTEKDQAFLKRNNTQYSQALAQWALANGTAFHYASSASIYGDGKLGFDDADEKLAQYKPLNFYGQSKWAFDKWLIDEKLTGRVVGYRYFNVFGPNEYHKGEMRSMVSKAFDQIKATGRARLFATTRPGFPDGSEERDFVYIKDVCDVMAYFLTHPDKHGIFNLGTGLARSFKDLVLAVFAAAEIPPEIEFIPMPDNLKNQYQYFTQATMTKLRAAGYKEPFGRLEVSVADYVKYHLLKSDPIL